MKMIRHLKTKSSIFLITAVLITAMGCEMEIREPSNGIDVIMPSTDIWITFIDGENPDLSVTLNQQDITSSFNITGPTNGVYEAFAYGEQINEGQNILEASVSMRIDGEEREFETESVFQGVLMPDPTGVVDEGPGVGAYCDLTYDVKGRPHISYYDEENKALKYAMFCGEGWKKMTITGNQPDTDAGRYSSIAVGSDGTAYISFYDADRGALKLAKYNRLRLQISFVDGPDDESDVGMYNCLRLDQDENPYIMYYDAVNHNLKLAIYNGASFTKYVIDGDQANSCGRWADFHLEADGTIKAAYHDGNGYDLKYAEGQDLNFAIETIDVSQHFTGEGISLGITPDGNPVIAYFDGTDLDLKLAQKVGSYFNFYTVRTEGATGFSPNVVITPSGTIYIVFYDYTAKSLLMARKVGGNFTIQTLDQGGSNRDVGRFAAAEYDPYGFLGICYQRSDTGQLLFKRISL